MRALVTELVLLVVLILVNGFFALSEAAVIASRKARLTHMARTGNRRAASALALTREPTRFLSTVQVGITLFGIIAGAYGGATLAGELTGLLVLWPPLAPVAVEAGFAVVVLGITYLSLVIGELAPKRIALSNPEAVASFVAPPMGFLTRLVTPVARILTWSTETVLRMLRVRSTSGSPVTEEEIRVMIDEGSESGVLEVAERTMVERVLALGDRRVSQFMVPRPDIVWLEVNDPPAVLRRKLERAGVSRLLVCRDDLDNVAGLVVAKDLLVGVISGSGLSLQSAMRQPLFIPESMTALKLLEEFKRKGTHVAVVVDEHGGTAGLVTVNDIAGAIVGDLAPSGDDTAPLARRRADGSWLVDGRLPIDELWTLLDIDGPPDTSYRGPYETVGGLVMFQLGRVPLVGDRVDVRPLRMEVTGMEGNRVETVIVRYRKTTEA